MEAVPSPQCVGREFVRQYYTLLNKAPLHLHRFYNHDSSFVHGCLKERLPQPVHGQQQIHQKIIELDFHDCKAKILLVDSHQTLDNGVVVQVSGELSNNGQPMRRFVQTFVLAPQSAKKYYVRNDIFRYQDDISDDDECIEERSIEQENEVPRANPTDLSLTNSTPVMDSPVAAATVTQSVTDGNVSGTMNGTDHHEEEAVHSRSSPPMQAAYQQIEPAAPVAPPQKVATPVESVPEKVEHPVEPIKEPEPAVVPNIPAKQIMEPAAPVIPSGPPELKTFANLFKAPSSYNGTTQGLPNMIPPFSSTKAVPTPAAPAPAAPTPSVPAAPAPVAPAPAPSTTTTSPQTVNELAATPTTNGNDNFTAAVPQRNNYRSGRSAAGNGRAGSGSYNRDRDNDRADNREASRDSNEEIGEWKQPNGEGYSRDRDYRRYDDNVQIFCGNIPHATTDENLKELFEEFGPVVEVRILGKGVRTPPGTGRAPLYAFIIFETSEAAEAALNKKPLFLNGDHRLNVEQKRRGGSMNTSGQREQRGGSMNRGGGVGGPGRGRSGGVMGQARGEGGRGMGGGRGGFVNRRQ